MANQMSSLIYSKFDELSTIKWCSQQAKMIISKYPCTAEGNSSGKFFKNYKCWHFHKSSSLPLIQAFTRLCEKHATSFKDQFKKSLGIEFIVLTYIEDASIEACIWHKDGHFFDGQMHLTILGNASIEVKASSKHKKIKHLRFPNGSFWYLNGSQYQHRISPFPGERIEICAPVNPLKEGLKMQLRAIRSESHEKLLKSSSPEWISLQKKYSQYVLQAIDKKTASNFKIADFSVDPRNPDGLQQKKRRD